MNDFFTIIERLFQQFSSSNKFNCKFWNFIKFRYLFTFHGNHDVIGPSRIAECKPSLSDWVSSISTWCQLHQMTHFTHSQKQFSVLDDEIKFQS